MPSVRRIIKSVLPSRVVDTIRVVAKGYVAVPDAKRAVFRIAEAGKFRMAYRIGTADEQVLAHSFDHDIYFAEIPEYQPTGSDTIIDVGGHIGTFSLLAGSINPNGRIFAVEPCRESFDLLCTNIALNDANNVSAHHVALGSNDGECRLVYGTDNWGHSTEMDLNGPGETTRAQTLESFFREQRIDRCALIKFNCEGAEFPILETASDELLQRIERFVILYHCDIARGSSVDALSDRLTRIGFSVRLINVVGLRGWLVATRNSHAA
ncbi:MAG: FkbM family methyltransferase [Planctomycetaceae bacterium]